MARSGIYKSEVLRARDKLLALGTYPSIDAVRVELGNTGSKATIHRFLKEIEEEEGQATGTKVAVSEALQDLVGRLAARLHEEADARLAEAASQHKAQTAQQSETIATLRQEGDAFRLQLEATQLALAEEKERHERTAAALQAETLERTQLAQQVTDLQERLAAEERHRQSLEEKHQNARSALEHFRQSIKEQRDQDLRQHEQQVQYLQGELRSAQQASQSKQHELTHAHQENVRVAGELMHAQRDLHQAREELRALGGMKENLAALEKETEGLRRRLVEAQATVQSQADQERARTALVVELQEKLQRTEIELASAKASLAAQVQIMEGIRGNFPRRRLGARSEIGTKPSTGDAS